MAGNAIDQRAERDLAIVERVSKATSSPPQRPFILRAASELIAQPCPPDWLVHGMLERDSMAMLFGPSGGGKSFAAIDFAASIATGTAWHGKAVAAGPCIYLCGEGHRGVRRRILAWSIARRVALDDAPLYVSDAALPLSNAIEAYRVTEAVDVIARRLSRPPQLVIVDTLARHFSGDESSAEEVGQLITACDEFLRAPYGATVLLIHHSGHATQDRARGSSALRAALDVEFQVARQDRTVILTCTKSKDAEPPDPQAFEICTVELPWLAEDGTPTVSAVLRPTTATSRDVLPTTGNQGKAVAKLQQMILEHRDRVAVGGGDPDAARVLLTDWRDGSALNRQRWAEVYQALIASGRVIYEAPYVRFA